MEGLLQQIRENATPYKPGSLTAEDVAKIFPDEPIHWRHNDCKYIYHKTVGFPSTLIIPDVMFNVEYTTHAKEQAKKRFKNKYKLPSSVRITPFNLIEAHTNNNKYIKKASVKLRYDDKRDLILVVALNFNMRKASVITVCYHFKGNTFDTLDKTKYNVPTERTELSDVPRSNGKLSSVNDKRTGSESR